MSEVKVSNSISIFVPGRICLFGEHSDWAGQMRKYNSSIIQGEALVACIEQGIRANVTLSDMLTVHSFDQNNSPMDFKCKMEYADLREISSGDGFFSYIAGVAAYLKQNYRIGGIEFTVTENTLPQKKGLSSSAAICVAVARAFNKLYDLNLTVRGEMEMAYFGEQMTQSRCGKLDQAVAFGRGVVHMIFDGDNLDVSSVKIGKPIHLVFADLNAEKDTITILRDLNVAYPYPDKESHRNLHQLLGEKNTEIVQFAKTALAEGDPERLGRLMTEAQSLFDAFAAPLSPKELVAPKLHEVLSDRLISRWSYGGKGVGSQGDGSIQFIAKDENSQMELCHYLNNQLGLQSYKLTIPKSPLVKKAVIPVAGMGTRMLPATSVVKKDLLPIVDFDGKAKPMIQILINGLRNSGIEDICLVIRHGEESIYRSLFGDSVTFAYQDEALGFGHAVLQSEKFAAGGSVVLCLGDHLFISNSNKTVFEQLIDSYEKSEGLTIGLFEVAESELQNYGIAKFKKDSSLETLIEKPEEDYENLRKNGKYYGVFVYVITPQVYKELYRETAENANNEVLLTPALDRVIRNVGAVGTIINGQRYDVGLPQEYRRTVAEYGI